MFIYVFVNNFHLNRLAMVIPIKIALPKQTENYLHPGIFYLTHNGLVQYVKALLLTFTRNFFKKMLKFPQKVIKTWAVCK